MQPTQPRQTTPSTPSTRCLLAQPEIPDAWFLALGVSERLKRGRQELDMARAARDPLRAELLLRRWRKLADLQDDRAFSRRLAALGCNRAELTALLLEPAPELRARLPGPSGWMSDLLVAWFTQPQHRDLLPRDAPPVSVLLPANLHEAAALAAPLIDLHVEWMLAEAATLYGSIVPIQRLVLRRVLTLLHRLQEAVGPTVAVERELAAREGELPPLLPVEEQRAQHLRLLADPARSWALLGRYPVLARDLASLARDWFQQGIDWLEEGDFSPDQDDPPDAASCDDEDDGDLRTGDRLGRALAASRHPDFLGSGLDREALRLAMLAVHNSATAGNELKAC